MEEVLRFKIILDETYEVKSGKGTAVMILFHGESDCENFSGKVLPGGVDTQVQCAGGEKTMSARYILEGTDREGCPCRIFVENQGIVKPREEPVITKPFIITDSLALKWLEEVPMTGKVSAGQDGEVLIRIYRR